MKVLPVKCAPGLISLDQIWTPAIHSGNQSNKITSYATKHNSLFDVQVVMVGYWPISLLLKQLHKVGCHFFIGFNHHPLFVWNSGKNASLSNEHGSFKHHKFGDY